ncbi:multidrug effflux MFS transporter [Cohnella sp. AR92]|uniref:multidrug effflux MFS transporter n=1 Tax=Cohnella sp. AR92 TaxID=648716 RepID=UPI000F8C77A5|nr:multidrug effflux MFS transporter [Cohnella sp. AR92]RUS49070.1 Bcr/CflA family efflux MFS transporter [Cohnella sp. AR92]
MNRLQSASAAPSRSRAGIAVILGILSAFGPFSLDLYLPGLPSVAEDLRTNASMAQLSLTACLIGLAFGQLLAGPLSDVRGRRIPLLVGLALYTVVSFLCLFTPSIGLFLALRFLQGLAGSAGIVISRAMARDLYSGTELTKFYSLLMLVNGLAPIAAPIAGGQLLHVTDWRGVFFVLALIGGATLLAVLLALPESLPKRMRSVGGLRTTLRSFGRIGRNRDFVGYAMSQGLAMAGMFAYIAGSPFVLQDIYGVSPQTFSVIFAVNGFGIILGSQLAGRLAGKVNDRSTLLLGLSLAAAAGVALLAAVLCKAGLWAILPALFIVVSSVGLISTSSFSLAMRDQGESAGSASALLGVLSFIFGGIVSPLVGLGGSDNAIPMGIVIASADVLALAFFFLLAGKKSSAPGGR